MTGRDLIIIIAHERQPAIHAERVAHHNPTATIVVWNAPAATCRQTAWRNADRDLLAAWRDVRPLKPDKFRRVAFLEADVAAYGPLPETNVPGGAWRTVTGGPLPRWRHFSERVLLPPGLVDRAIGGFPLAVTFLTPAAADAATRPEWAEVFAADIFCELRLPTVVAAAGYPVSAVPLPGVRGHHALSGLPFSAVQHPVKSL